jgi:hypothetical protein
MAPDRKEGLRGVVQLCEGDYGMPLGVASFHASGEAADRNDLERGVVQGRYRTRQMNHWVIYDRAKDLPEV